MPPMWELARRAEEHVKGLIVPGTLFEELGFNYFGPVDGHDINEMVATLRNLREIRGLAFAHRHPQGQGICFIVVSLGQRAFVQRASSRPRHL